MRRFRAASLAVATLLVAGCANPSGAPASIGRGPATPTGVVATFTGIVDPSTGRLSLQVDPASDPGALTLALPFYDGAPGTGPVNSFEIVTDPTVVPSTVPLDCDGGTVNAWEGDVAVRSFFRNQTLKNVHVEVTTLSPPGHSACNSVTTPVPGVATSLSNTYGLWSYGDLVPDGTGTGSVSSTQRWKFRLASSEAFSFQGRIWATLAAPVAVSGGPEFDWAATSLVDPPRSFQDVATTVSHLVWNGTSFVDSRGATTFTKVAATGGSVSTHLADPDQPYATFGDGVYYVETTASGNASALDLSRGFTVCAKIKPGVMPGSGIKTIFAKGNPILATGVANPLGFALMQMDSEYCFHYRSPDNNPYTASELRSYLTPGPNPEQWTYDYICGGRANTDASPTDGYLWVGVHGAGEIAMVQDETGWYDGSTLPLVIGATAGGLRPAQDVGLYEVIIDSRGATAEIMRELVAAAEGRLLPGAGSGSARYEPSNSSSTPATGANGVDYTLPPFATVPVSTDGTGLLAAGTVLRYTHPLKGSTPATGFCIGADLQATGPWSSVTGTLLQFDNTSMNIVLNEGGRGFHWYNDNIYVFDGWSAEGAWADGSEHVLKACIGPQGTGNTAALYLDASTTPVATQTPAFTLTVPDLSDATSKLTIGGRADVPNPVTGARIRRLFICPGPNPASCH